MHRILSPTPLPATLPSDGATLLVDGDEAHHALAVKRLRPGEPVELLDARGGLAAAHFQGEAPGRPRRDRAILVHLTSVRHLPPPTPDLTVFTALPKGDRIDDLVDALAQLGAAAWAPLLTRRAVVHPREARLDRLERIALEAMKQCGRPWPLRLDPPATPADLLASPRRLVVADAAGMPYAPPAAPDPRPIALLIGPEGGWDAAELADFAAAGAALHRFGPHVMRIATAAAAACAIVLDAELRGPRDRGLPAAEPSRRP